MPEVSAATPVADSPGPATASPAEPLAEVVEESAPEPQAGNDDAPPVEELPGVSIVHPISNDAFTHRVDVLMNAMRDNPENQLRCMAEIHSYLSLFEEGFREMQTEMAAGGGPFGLLRKMLFSKGA